MNLLHVYNLLNTGDISLAQAAAAYGFTEQNMKFRITRHGARLPFMLATLDKIRADKITRDEAAEALGITVRQVNKLMNSWDVVRPLPETRQYLVSRASAQIKWEMRKKYAIDFIEGTLNFEMAAEAANCSVRQIRRWVGDLLEKHYGMPYKDLALIELPKRRRLAQEIRTAEDLERAKQTVVDAIADGKMSVKDEAIKRVKDARTVRRKVENGA